MSQIISNITPILLSSMALLNSLVQAIVVGILQGGIYALISVGLTLIFGVLGIVNFAQAEFLMLGMYTSFFLFVALAVDPFLSALAIIPLFFLFGIVVYRLLIDPLLETADEESQLVVTFGLLLVLQSVTLIWLGPSTRLVNVGWSTTNLTLGSVVIGYDKLFAFVFAGLMLSLTYLFLNRTMLGKAIKATANDVNLARYSGINTKRIYALTFGIGIALTASAGSFVVTYFPAYPSVGFEFIIIMFVVVVLGGMGNIKGAAIAGLMIGVLEQVAVIWIPLQLQPSLAYVVFVLVIMFRPEGVFGDPQGDVQ